MANPTFTFYKDLAWESRSATSGKDLVYRKRPDLQPSDANGKTIRELKKANGTSAGVYERITPVDIRDFADRSSAGYTSSIIQVAQNTLNKLGGGLLELPLTEKYNIDAAVNLKPGVFMQGRKQISRLSHQMPQFNIYYGKNNLNTHAFLMDVDSAMGGFSFNYPDQRSPTYEGDPYQYGFAVAARDLRDSSNNRLSVDGIFLRDLMFKNAYQAINLDFAGQHNVRDISGFPMYRGIYVDRIYDVGRIDNIHFWTFVEGGYNPNAGIGKWVKNNGRAFDFRKVDCIMNGKFIAYGYKEGLWFDASPVVGGAPWVQMNQMLFDVCERPIHIEKAEIIHIGLVEPTNDTYLKPLVSTGLNVGTDAQVTISDMSMYSGANFGAVVSSSTGVFKFKNVTAKSKNAGNGLKGCPVVNEERGATVFVEKLIHEGEVLGLGKTFVGDVRLAKADVEFVPAANPLTKASWQYYDQFIIQDGNNLRFRFGEGNRFFSYRLNLNENFIHNVGGIIMTFSATRNKDFRFSARICTSDGGETYHSLYNSTGGFVTMKTDGTNQIRFPFSTFIGEVNAGTLIEIRIEGETYDGIAQDLILSECRFYTSLTESTNQSTFDLISSRLEPVANSRVSKNIIFAGTNKILFTKNKPTWQNCRIGDRAVNIASDGITPLDWLFTSTGWKSYKDFIDALEVKSANQRWTITNNGVNQSGAKQANFTAKNGGFVPNESYLEVTGTNLTAINKNSGYATIGPQKVLAQYNAGWFYLSASSSADVPFSPTAGGDLGPAYIRQKPFGEIPDGFIILGAIINGSWSSVYPILQVFASQSDLQQFSNATTVTVSSAIPKKLSWWVRNSLNELVQVYPSVKKTFSGATMTGYIAQIGPFGVNGTTATGEVEVG